MRLTHKRLISSLDASYELHTNYERELKVLSFSAILNLITVEFQFKVSYCKRFLYLAFISCGPTQMPSSQCKIFLDLVLLITASYLHILNENPFHT